MSKMKKLILAVPVNPARMAGIAKLGFNSMGENEIFDGFQKSGGWFGPRGELETNKTFVQVIPYVVLLNGNDVVCYRRTTSGGDSRLHDSYSIGAGGHIDIEDYSEKDGVIDFRSTVEKAAVRELNEEFGLSDGKIEWVGTIYDDSNSVGQVHIGIVGILRVSGPVKSTEDELDNIEVININMIDPNDEKWETWSSIIIKPILDTVLGQDKNP